MVFLCFSSGDRYEIVKSFLYHFKNYGLEVWYDYHKLVLGDNKQKINFENAINNSKYFVIIYSKNFFNSTCALKEEEIIRKKYRKENIRLFPVIYNMKFSELPFKTQRFIEKIIYNEIEPSHCCLPCINQILTRIIMDDINAKDDNVPEINKSLINTIEDRFLVQILTEYLNIDYENFNAKISILYCAFLYIKNLPSKKQYPEYWEKGFLYLSKFSHLNIPYNHKEIIIAELIIIGLIKNLLL